MDTRDVGLGGVYVFDDDEDIFNDDRKKRGGKRSRYNDIDLSKWTPDFLTRNYKRFFAFSFILLLVAIIVMGASKYPPAPNRDNYDESDNYDKALRTYNIVINSFETTSNIFFTIGILLLGFLFLMAPFVDIKFHPVLRIAMLAIGMLILTHFLSAGFRFQISLG